MTVEDDNPVVVVEDMEDSVVEEKTELVKKEPCTQTGEEAQLKVPNGRGGTHKIEVSKIIIVRYETHS